MKKDIIPINSDDLEAQFKANYPDLDSNQMRIIDVDIDDLVANKNQTRFKYDNFEDEALLKEEDGDLQKLADSIEKYGLQQPIGIHKKPTKIFNRDGSIKKIKTWEVIFGHRRVFAHKKLGLKTIKAIVYTNKNMENIQEEGFDIEKTLMLNIIENLQRENFNIVEEAAIYQKLKKQREKTEKSRISYEKIAKLLQIDPTRVYRTIRIVNSLDETILEELKNKDTKKDIIFLVNLIKLKDIGTEQIKMWDRFQKGKINREQALEEIEGILNAENLDKKKTKPKTFKGGIYFVKDNQGLKIRYDKLNHLGFEEEYELQKQLAGVITEFIEKTKKKKPQPEITDSENTNPDEKIEENE